MARLTYVALLAGCLLVTLPLELWLHTGVYRRWRRLLVAVVPVFVMFGAWDVYAVIHRQWWYDAGQTIGVLLPHRIPIEEALFFVVVPVCAVLAFEAVRVCTGWRVGDQR